MPIFYKATRPDGTDFRTGAVDYGRHLADGTLLPELPSRDGRRKCCTDTVYHASTSKADTLIGGKWPCRLFEVEGDPVAEEDNKRGFVTLRVVRELPAWEALGPNGREVAALVERAGRLSMDEVRRLGAARDAAWDAAWDDARDVVRGAARDAAWDAARDAARDAAWDAAWGDAWDDAWDAAWDAAWGATWGAAALVVRDLITPEQFDILYGPWASVVERTEG